MKKKHLFPVLLTILAACNNRINKTGAAESNTIINNISGTYRGTLPCADCPGTDLQISLYDDHTFRELTAYQGTKAGSAIIDNGTWKQTTDSTIILKKKKNSSFFLVADGKLVMLSTQGKRLDGELADNYVLNPVEGGNQRALQAAKANAGIRFTANGNEPFWMLDLDSKKIFFHTMNGDSLQITLPPAKPDTDSFKVYTTPTLKISIRNKVCVDDMSGLMHTHTVEVQVKDKIYQGCGEYLK